MKEASESFARLYDEQVWVVYGYFGYRLGSREDAEDLTQRTFERALEAWHRYDPARGRPSTWLLSIARNLLIDHYRTDRSDRERPIDGQELPFEREAAADDEDRRLGPDPELQRALASLPDRDRELIALRFGADLSGREIADLTGLSLANVQQILSRDLRRLRGLLEAASQG